MRPMFTGLVQAMGRIKRIAPAGADGGVSRIEVLSPPWTCRPGAGDSIAISGCCLTVVDSQDAQGGYLLSFDVVPQTLERTRLGSCQEGDGVNLETAATPEMLLGGHMVQGHVDGVGQRTAAE